MIDLVKRFFKFDITQRGQAIQRAVQKKGKNRTGDDLLADSVDGRDSGLGILVVQGLTKQYPRHNGLNHG